MLLLPLLTEAHPNNTWWTRLTVKKPRVKPTDWLSKGEYSSNLFSQREQDINSLEVEEVAAQNKAEFWRMERLAREPIESTARRAEFIDQSQAQKILDQNYHNQVVGFNKQKQYDPDLQLGFCFGRAMFTHLYLLHSGVAKESIMKAWVIGPMLSDGLNWEYHVATIVKASDGGWWVIDRVAGRIIKIEEWFEKMQGMSTDDKLRIYFTSASRFSPFSDETYNPRDLGLMESSESDFYNSYFKDMLNYFSKNREGFALKRFEEEYNYRNDLRDLRPMPFDWRPISADFFKKSCESHFE